MAKTHLQHILIATAINLVRVVAWLTEPRPPKRRVAPLAALAFAAEEFANRVLVGFRPCNGGHGGVWTVEPGDELRVCTGAKSVWLLKKGQS